MQEMAEKQRPCIAVIVIIPLRGSDSFVAALALTPPSTLMWLQFYIR
jgi:hypothetical protein